MLIYTADPSPIMTHKPKRVLFSVIKNHLRNLLKTEILMDSDKWEK